MQGGLKSPNYHYALPLLKSVRRSGWTQPGVYFRIIGRPV